jgi:phage tail tape-measure protein
MDVSGYYESLKGKMKDFLEKMSLEKDETKEAFKILMDSVNEGKKLTDDEKEKIGEQMKDVLKTIGLVGATVLPGGFIYFLIVKVFKLNEYALPSSFNKKEDKKK